MGAVAQIKPGLSPSLEALDHFEEHIRKVATYDDFLLPEELLEGIIRNHIGCCVNIEEALEEIDGEIQIMKKTLKEEADRLFPGSAWPEAVEQIPSPTLPEDGLVGLYRQAVKSCGKHCRDVGLVTPDLYRNCPVRVEPVPNYLSAIRTAASYSMPPGHPPSGGTFFVIEAGSHAKMSVEATREYRMLTAHETYPGHHLLDASRWSLNRPLRRHFEFPFFYEGWACLAEDLMARTGYFASTADRLLITRRRLWRALRGKVDLSLQTGIMDIPGAARYLSQAGLSPKHALSAVRKYTLRPGYQVCYTLGLKRFLDLFERYGENDPACFARTVLAQGEIGFKELERIFQGLNRKQEKKSR